MTRSAGAIAPRNVDMPGRDRSPSQGQYSWWWRAAEPKSHRIGSPASPSPRGSRQKRISLSMPQVPMWVDVM